MNRITFRALFFGLLAAGFLASGCTTQPKPDLGPDIKLRNTKVLLMPLDVEVSEITAGGLVEPKSEWTQQGQSNLDSALSNLMTQRQITLAPINSNDLDREDVFQRIKLMQVVGETVLLATYTRPGVGYLSLPTKEDKNWTVGDTLQTLKQKYEVSHALFFNMRDYFSSEGRVALGVLLAVASLGHAIMPSGQQSSYAFLVDLETGKVIWTALRRGHSFGDVRTSEGAKMALENLFDTFPDQ